MKNIFHQLLKNIDTYSMNYRRYLALLLIIFLGVIISPKSGNGSIIFLEPENITDIIRQVSEIGIIALGITLVIFSAGIDLSVGSILALSACVVTLLLTDASASSSNLFLGISGPIIIALIISTIIGALNGLAVAYMRIQPFIVTLAMMFGVRGLARLVTNNANIDIGFGDDIASSFAAILSEKYFVIMMYIILCIILSVLFKKTIYGRLIRAIGDNLRAAKYTGIAIEKIQIGVYALCGFLAGLAGIIHAAQNHQGSPNAGNMYELEAIAAVVIGGTALSGGRGSISGTIIGTLIMGIMTNILRLNNVDANIEMVLKSVIIIIAVKIQTGRSES
jgi:ribose transport system permease protein